jgi:hypothetical protein
MKKNWENYAIHLEEQLRVKNEELKIVESNLDEILNALDELVDARYYWNSNLHSEKLKDKYNDEWENVYKIIDKHKL